MRRALALPALAAIAVVLVLLVAGGSGGSYRVDAIFDSAKGIVPGQQVKIAGARVGTIVGVRLAPGPRARIELSVENRFGPFHADAACRILPEGFISENYVECDPGSRAAPALAVRGAQAPTVPLTHTTVPVSLQDVINIFSLPVSERAAVMIDELGIGTAARGSDIAAILRRANPALTQSRRVLGILDAQDQQLAGAVAQTDEIVTALAGRRAAVRGFVDHAAAVTSTTAAHRGALAAGVHGLPAMLSAIRDRLAPLDRVAVEGTPLLESLRLAAPGLTRLTQTLPAFTAPGLVALRALGRVSARGIASVRAAEPVLSELARLATQARPIVAMLDGLLIGSRDSGAVEGALQLVYSLATDSASYDSVSHVVTALIVPYAQCLVSAAVPGCSHAYSAPGYGSPPVNGTGASRLSAASAKTLRSMLDYLVKP